MKETLRSSGFEAAANLGEVKTPLFDVLKASHEKRDLTRSDEIGLCWQRKKLKNGELMVWHNGGTGGYRSMIAFTPATKQAVIMLCAASLGPEFDILAFTALEAFQPK